MRGEEFAAEIAGGNEKGMPADFAGDLTQKLHRLLSGSSVDIPDKFARAIARLQSGRPGVGVNGIDADAEPSQAAHDTQRAIVFGFEHDDGNRGIGKTHVAGSRRCLRCALIGQGFYR